MSRKACWRVATIVEIAFVIFVLCSEYAFLGIMGLIAVCIPKGPKIVYIKVTMFIAEVLYGMFGKAEEEPNN